MYFENIYSNSEFDNIIVPRRKIISFLSAFVFISTYNTNIPLLETTSDSLIIIKWVNLKMRSFFLCAKTRVVLLKSLSIARLELCTALLLIHLLTTAKESLLNINFNQIRLWSDSQITLWWIKSPHHRWLPFVVNPVKKIQDRSENAVGDYIKTDENPAVIASKGIKPTPLKDHNLWWNGPKFLVEKITAFSNHIDFECTKLQPIGVRQSRKIIVAHLSFKNITIERYSSFLKLIRVICWIIPFLRNAHFLGPQLCGPLKVFEIQQATFKLIKIVQLKCFSPKMKKLKNNMNVDKSVFECLLRCPSHKSCGW